MTCTVCGKTEDTIWDFGEEIYCQMCWEAHCSKTWWEAMESEGVQL